MSTTTDSAEKVGLDPTVDFIAGIVSGIAGLVVGYPFDTVKVRFQTPAMTGKYHSTFQAINTIVREEKFAGLYKGILSPLTTAALLNGLLFASYRFFVKLQLDGGDAIPTLTQVGLAGAFTGVVGALVTTPTELIKIRQQDQLVPTNARQVILKVYQEAGVFGLYRGITATILRDLGYGAYFLAYEGAYRYLSTYSHIKESPWVAPLLAGAVAGVAGWAFTFPFDLVKTRMQGTAQCYPVIPSEVTHPTSKQPLLSSTRYSSSANSATIPTALNPYRTVISTVINSYKSEGAGVFFRGLAPTLIRAIPVNMVTFATFEAAVHALS